MTTETTPAPLPAAPYTTEQQLAAGERAAALRVTLQSRYTGKESADYVDKQKLLMEIAAYDNIHAWTPPETPAPTPPVAEILQHRATATAIQAEMLRHPYGSPQATAMREALLRHEQDRAATLPAPPTGITKADVFKTPSAAGWSAQDKQELWLRLSKAPVTNEEKVLAFAAVQNVREQNRMSRAATRGPAAVDDETMVLAERAMGRLFPDPAYQEALMAEGAFSRGAESLVRMLAELERRVTTR